MAGRTLALWCRLADPAEARRHVPDLLELDEDPVVRVRFWDMLHDAGLGTDVQASNPEFGRFREVAVLFPVRWTNTSGEVISGEFTAYMYSDDPTYTAFGREVMGWPVRHGRIHMSRPWADTVVPGMKLTGLLERHGRSIMRAGLELTGTAPGKSARAISPTWISLKVVPAADGPQPALRQLVASRPDGFDPGVVWIAAGELEVSDGEDDELAFLRPRSIERAEYWSRVNVTVGWGRVLAEIATEGDR